METVRVAPLGSSRQSRSAAVYPGDETPVCTRQMCSLRDRWDDYLANWSEVVGISSTSFESHKNFAAKSQFAVATVVGF
jgi:peroxiredoxin